MPRHCEIDVVIIKRMADRAIDERSRERRKLRLMADDAGLRRAAGFG
jgi:hypothetical protein